MRLQRSSDVSVESNRQATGPRSEARLIASARTRGLPSRNAMPSDDNTSAGTARAFRASRPSAAASPLAREDLRHLLKHKRHYLPQSLTARERAILASPSLLARACRRIAKPPYVFVTRRLLGWPERSGPAERQSHAATLEGYTGSND
jgi:hypothetical protein